jgi:hypothetical protein
METITETISVSEAKELRETILSATAADHEVALALLDRWFERERKGELRFEQGVREILKGLRGPRRH